MSFRDAFKYWLRLGFISFGGPAGQIAIMHEELVEKRRWISERRFLHALNYCIGFVGAWGEQVFGPQALAVAGIMGAVVATFLPFYPPFCSS